MLDHISIVGNPWPYPPTAVLYSDYIAALTDSQIDISLCFISRYRNIIQNLQAGVEDVYREQFLAIRGHFMKDARPGECLCTNGSLMAGGRQQTMWSATCTAKTNTHWCALVVKWTVCALYTRMCVYYCSECGLHRPAMYARYMQHCTTSVHHGIIRLTNPQLILWYHSINTITITTHWHYW